MTSRNDHHDVEEEDDYVPPGLAEYIKQADETLMATQENFFRALEYTGNPNNNNNNNMMDSEHQLDAMPTEDDANLEGLRTDMQSIPQGGGEYDPNTDFIAATVSKPITTTSTNDPGAVQQHDVMKLVSHAVSNEENTSTMQYSDEIDGEQYIEIVEETSDNERTPFEQVYMTPGNERGLKVSPLQMASAVSSADSKLDLVDGTPAASPTEETYKPKKLETHWSEDAEEESIKQAAPVTTPPQTSSSKPEVKKFSPVQKTTSASSSKSGGSMAKARNFFVGGRNKVAPIDAPVNVETPSDPPSKSSRVTSFVAAATNRFSASPRAKESTKTASSPSGPFSDMKFKKAPTTNTSLRSPPTDGSKPTPDDSPESKRKISTKPSPSTTAKTPSKSAAAAAAKAREMSPRLLGSTKSLTERSPSPAKSSSSGPKVPSRLMKETAASHARHADSEQTIKSTDSGTRGMPPKDIQVSSRLMKETAASHARHAESEQTIKSTRSIDSGTRGTPPKDIQVSSRLMKETATSKARHADSEQTARSPSPAKSSSSGPKVSSRLMQETAASHARHAEEGKKSNTVKSPPVVSPSSRLMQPTAAVLAKHEDMTQPVKDHTVSPAPIPSNSHFMQPTAAFEAHVHPDEDQRPSARKSPNSQVSDRLTKRTAASKARISNATIDSHNQSSPQGRSNLSESPVDSQTKTSVTASSPRTRALAKARATTREKNRIAQETQSKQSMSSPQSNVASSDNRQLHVEPHQHADTFQPDVKSPSSFQQRLSDSRAKQNMREQNRGPSRGPPQVQSNEQPSFASNMQRQKEDLRTRITALSPKQGGVEQARHSQDATGYHNMDNHYRGEADINITQQSFAFDQVSETIHVSGSDMHYHDNRDKMPLQNTEMHPNEYNVSSSVQPSQLFDHDTQHTQPSYLQPTISSNTHSVGVPTEAVIGVVSSPAGLKHMSPIAHKKEDFVAPQSKQPSSRNDLATTTKLENSASAPQARPVTATTRSTPKLVAKPTKNVSSRLLTGTASSRARVTTTASAPAPTARSRVAPKDSRVEARERVRQKLEEQKKINQERAMKAKLQRQNAKPTTVRQPVKVDDSTKKGGRITAEQGILLAKERVRQRQMKLKAAADKENGNNLPTRVVATKPVSKPKAYAAPPDKVQSSGTAQTQDTSRLASPVPTMVDRPTHPQQRSHHVESNDGRPPLIVSQEPKSMISESNLNAAKSHEDFSAGSVGSMSRNSRGSDSSRKLLTVPKAPNFATTARLGERLVTPVKESVPLAKSSDNMMKGLREETPATVSCNTTRLTIPESPQFHTSSHNSRKKVKSKEEQEQEMMTYYKSHPFKARPVPQTILHTAPKVHVRKPENRRLTVAQPFNFKSEERIAVKNSVQEGINETKSSDEVEIKKKFRARPMPNFSKAPAVKPIKSKEKVTTTPTPFTFHTSAPKPVSLDDPDEIELKKQFKARPSPQSTWSTPSPVKVKTKPVSTTISKAPSLRSAAQAEKRAAAAEASRRRAEQLAREKEKATRLRAKEKFVEEMKKLEANKNVLSPAELKPLHLRSTELNEKFTRKLSEKRRTEYEMESEEKLRQMIIEEDQEMKNQSVYKANPKPWHIYDGYVQTPIKKSPIGPTTPTSPKLSSEKRSEARRLYNEKADRERAERQAKMLEEQAKLLEVEEKALLERRRKPVSEGGLMQIANPIRYL